jgi:hypothetical protein
MTRRRNSVGEWGGEKIQMLGEVNHWKRKRLQ